MSTWIVAASTGGPSTARSTVSRVRPPGTTPSTWIRTAPVRPDTAESDV